MGRYKIRKTVLAAGLAVICMFSNVCGAETAGPPRPAALTVTPSPTPGLTVTPTSTPTPEPTVTPAADTSDPASQGTLTKPDHPDTVEADKIGDNTAVIILMGVNDLYHVNSYISYINAKAAEWSAKGAQTYFVSVGPVQNDPYASNAEIESFNASMQANLSGVTYIDIYSHLVTEGFSTLDGTHYPDSVSVDIYNYILDHLEEQRSGIWG